VEGMDPALFPIVNALAPVLASLAFCGSVVGFYWVGKHYKLREKEIELEAELHGKRIEAELRATEVRLAAVENSILGRSSLTGPGERASLIEAPPQLPTKVR
jgi:hypothetical protein